MTSTNDVTEARSDYAEAGEEHCVYLTFDDGPNPHCTPAILDVLAQHRAPATFCVIGAYAAGQPELIQRIIAEGHEIANHTMTHPELSKCMPDEAQYEILTTNKVIGMACPRASVRHMRAPYGIWTKEALAASAKADLAALHWSVDPQDWARPGVEAIVAAVLTSLQPGAIVLLHDGCPPDELGRRPDAGRRDQTVMALAQLIPALHDRGFAIRSLPQPNRIDQCP
ncbi:chitooligosaccharide deacetylase NodB [Bradyrhizobium sp. CSS354]|uniref:chitooligosaccharide deacetylase NodB n=1 Tax=Bradyrhizobium sp. CSS354 TaxID=2699172 RepID=UPI0023AF4334|nr:chitooligosaccharide deacetylase NodB [Bradyrhizobium sp. CSS354]MDE5465702.1 chitooligosaccharide deacetylase NodB [Bradyrhizobium sp. CSS354]